MKKTVKILIIALLCVLLIYICFVNNISENMILFKNENIELPKFLGITFKIKNENGDIISTSSDLRKKSNNIQNKSVNVDVQLLNTLTLKTINIDIIERTKVIPVGQVAGLKLYTNGVLVVGMSSIKGLDNINYKPYENIDIQEGDMIVKINNEEVFNTEMLLEMVKESKGQELDITYIRDNNYKNCRINPIQTSENEYKIGLWVRDSAAGIGTMTYYILSTGEFAALGHGITDIDTGNLINISEGDFITTKIVSIVKGLRGNPGKIQGTIDNQTTIGKINKNTNLGVFGEVYDITSLNISRNDQIDVAKKEEIQLGEADILCSLDGQKAKEYKVEIEKIFLNNDYDNKSMLIKVKDEELITKTGGIIQGMSGCPVIQNGKFIGAITNVLVNDPTQGYAVFGELMLKQSS